MSSPPTEDELSRDFLTMKRKSAFRQKKIMVIRGHEFVLHFFKEPTYCGHCRQFVWFVLAPRHSPPLRGISIGVCDVGARLRPHLMRTHPITPYHPRTPPEPHASTGVSSTRAIDAEVRFVSCRACRSPISSSVRVRRSQEMPRPRGVRVPGRRADPGAQKVIILCMAFVLCLCSGPWHADSVKMSSLDVLHPACLSIIVIIVRDMS